MAERRISKRTMGNVQWDKTRNGIVRDLFGQNMAHMD